jgi:hypothetical protein
MDTHPQGSRERRDYLSYLLRLWREGGEGRSVWRASLKSSHTGEEVGFGSLEELFEFLQREMGTLPGADRSGQEA